MFVMAHLVCHWMQDEMAVNNFGSETFWHGEIHSLIQQETLISFDWLIDHVTDLLIPSWKSKNHCWVEVLVFMNQSIVHSPFTVSIHHKNLEQTTNSTTLSSCKDTCTRGHETLDLKMTDSSIMNSFSDWLIHSNLSQQMTQWMVFIHHSIHLREESRTSSHARKTNAFTLDWSVDWHDDHMILNHLID